MEPGFLVDHSRQTFARPGQWVSGEPARSIWFGVKTGGRKRITMTAHRCPRCGRLELYAPQD
jgi:hypothetical protein